MWNFTCELEMSGHLKFTEYALDSKASIQCEASKLDLLPSSFTLFTAVCCAQMFGLQSQQCLVDMFSLEFKLKCILFLNIREKEIKPSKSHPECF